MKTILITGCSSGFGLETARYFLERDWNVIATMRRPSADILAPSERLRVLALDVADPDSIQEAAEAAGQIDALVNNAGVGMLGILEATPMETVRSVFETNTFGTIAVTRAFLPRLREQGSGAIVNVTSSTTLKPLPMLPVYTASKAAVEAFTESLALELEPFNIRARLVIPGRSPETSFRQNAQSRLQEAPEAYAGFAKAVLTAMSQPSETTTPQDVAEAVWRAVTDPASPTRIPAGADAIALAGAA